MKLDQIHTSLVDHYKKVRTLKTKRSKQIESVVGQVYKKKQTQIDDSSPYEDFLRNQAHLAVEEESLYFRSLPRKLQVYFPGPPAPPPELKQIPYTYEIVPKVPFKLPKQKPGYVGEWVLEECKFSDRNKSVINGKISSRNSFNLTNKTFCTNKKNSKSMIQSYQQQNSITNGKQNLNAINSHDRRERFRSEVKRIANQMKQKNLSLKQIIKNKGMVKKPHNFYNSTDFFLMARAGETQNIQRLLSNNPQLAFDVDDQQMTGLHWAAREGHSQICRLLTQKFRSSTQSKDMYGRTPLHLAVQNKNIECIIRIFIEGGQLNALNNNKKSVRSVAPDAYTRYLLEKLEEIKFVVKAKKYESKEEERQFLEISIRNTLDESSLYF